MVAQTIQSLPAFFEGVKFRSRLEARWAIFFEHCGMKWEYEPEGYQLDNGQCYLPDFLLHDLVGRVSGDLFVEVKGVLTEDEAEKIRAFIGVKEREDEGLTPLITRPLLLVGNIFFNGNNRGYVDRVWDMWCDARCPSDLEFFSYATIDGDPFGALLGVNLDRQAETFGADDSYFWNYDESKTESAFRAALTAQFSRHGKYMYSMEDK